MTDVPPFNRSRRDVLRAGVATGAWAAFQPSKLLAAEADVLSLPPITRAIPSTGEQIPVIGIGTNQYDVTSAQDIAARREVLQAMPQLGGRLIDTARGYGRSEEVIGTLLTELANRDRFFIATKPVSAPQAEAQITRALLDESFRQLRTDRIDLLQVHSLLRLDELLPLFLEYKRAGRIPAWASDFDAITWAQFMLKYCLANPAVTVVIPGTTTLARLKDNLGGGRGRLPDAATLRRMEQFWTDL